MEAYVEEYGVEGCDTLQKLLSSKEPVVIAFSSPTCGACMMYKPEFEAAKEIVNGKARFIWFNIASCPNAAFELGIPGTPTTIVIVNGEIAGAWIGAVPVEQLVEAVTQIISSYQR